MSDTDNLGKLGKAWRGVRHVMGGGDAGGAPPKAQIAILNRTVDDLRKQVKWLEMLTEKLLVEQRGYCLLPPERLRMHIGARESAANFWNQGRHSSQRVLEVFGENPSGPVLDWGCGCGRTLYWLHAHTAWREQYRGCDVDAEAIKWLRKQGTGGVAVCAPAPPLPYADGTFAGLFCFSVLTHIHPLQHRGWIEDIHRIVRPGGRAYLTANSDAHVGDPGAFRERDRQAYREQGWVYVEHPGHYKSAAAVSLKHMMASLDGLFELEQHRQAGYHRMDDFVVRRI